MRDFSNRSGTPLAANSIPHRKRLGSYLIEAGLLTPAQVDVALNDQKLTGMRFGEVLVARGWVKQQTIEYLMQKVILPEQRALQEAHRATEQRGHQPGSLGKPALSLPLQPSRSASAPVVSSDERKPVGRKDVPIAKPLPSKPTSDDDVSWVG